MFRSHRHANRLAVIAVTVGTSAILAGPADAQCETSNQADSPRPAQLASYNKDMNIVETAVNAGSFKTLATALQKTGLDKALSGDGPFTVFAPTDAAFAKLPKGTLETLLKPENRDTLAAILKYHVVAGEWTADEVTRLGGIKTLNGQRITFETNGSNVMIDGATVAKANIEASNGVIHVIDSVLLPSSNNIVDVAKSAGQFNTLIAAAKAAGLVPALTGDKPLTVLAPTDAAFNKLPAGTVESLLKPENRHKLVAVLKYHVIPGRAFADDAIKAGSVDSLQGNALFFDIRNGRLNVNGAKVMSTDINASNGVVHVIDTVLFP